MKRSDVRESVFKYLFIAEFNKEEEMPEQIKCYFEGAGVSMENFDDENKLPSEDVSSEIKGRYEKVKENLPEIDKLLNESSVGWKTNRMSKVDLCVMRLAAYEMLYDPSVSVGTAINEAVELAKTYGGAESSSFVNGVLGKIARDKNL